MIDPFEEFSTAVFIGRKDNDAETGKGFLKAPHKTTATTLIRWRAGARGNRQIDNRRIEWLLLGDLPRSILVTGFHDYEPSPSKVQAHAIAIERVVVHEQEASGLALRRVLVNLHGWTLRSRAETDNDDL